MPRISCCQVVARILNSCTKITKPSNSTSKPIMPESERLNCLLQHQRFQHLCAYQERICPNVWILILSLGLREGDNGAGSPPKKAYHFHYDSISHHTKSSRFCWRSFLQDLFTQMHVIDGIEAHMAELPRTCQHLKCWPCSACGAEMYPCHQTLGLNREPHRRPFRRTNEFQHQYFIWRALPAWKMALPKQGQSSTKIQKYLMSKPETHGLTVPRRSSVKA